MIDFDEALAIVLAHATPLGTRTVSLASAVGAVIAEDVVTRAPMPAFASSSVDGYALRAADTRHARADRPATFPVAGVVFAGDAVPVGVAPRTVVKIMTGAMIPAGVDAVVMKEDVTPKEAGIAIIAPVRKGANIRPRGAEYAKGETVLRRGTRITPPVAGLLATVGAARVRVFRMPRVAIVATGDELRAPGARLKPGQIRDANTTALTAALAMLGITPVMQLTARDTLTHLTGAIGDALNGADLVMTVGGVSVGDRDHVREALHALGVRERFWRVAMKPGKPVAFGTKGRKLVFALPGNPVSALLAFHLLVRPAIERMIGVEPAATRGVWARLAADLRKEPGRAEFVRMCVTRDARGAYDAAPVRGRESHMLGGLAEANALYRFPGSATARRRGARVFVELLDWGWW